MGDRIQEQLGQRDSIMLGKILNSQPQVQTSPDPRVKDPPRPPVSQMMPMSLNDSFPAMENMFRMMRPPYKRIQELEYYDFLETQIADVAKALQAYATLATTGSITGGKSGAYTIVRQDGVDYPDELIERLDRAEKIVRAHAQVAIQMMCKYGSYMPQPVFENDGGRLHVSDIHHIPPGTIFRNLIKGGIDPDRYWVQVIDGKVVGTGQSFNGTSEYGLPRWFLLHFAIWSSVVDATTTKLYGTSLLRPFGAIGLKMEAAIDASVVARLSRAAMRYKWTIDCSDIRGNQAAIAQRMHQWMQMLSRRNNLLDNASTIDSSQRGRVPDSDVYVPGGEGLDYDVDTITGDSNVSNVADMEFLSRFYFGALGVPPEYLGHSRSQGGRSSLTQIDIHFARTVRHIQLYACPPMEQLVWMEMLLGGFSPMEYPIQILPPPIGARDELIQAQIRALQAQVIATLRQAGMDLTVSPRWILETFMNMDDELEDLEDEDIDNLFERMPELQGGGGQNGSPNGQQKQALKEALMKSTDDLWDAMKNNLMLLRLNSNTDYTGFSNELPSEDELALAAKEIGTILTV